jgi:signal transduction histidine kinase
LISPVGGGALKFSTDGRRLTCYWGNDFLFKTFEVAPGGVCRFLHLPQLGPRERSKLAPNPGGSWSVEFSPDGRLLVTGHQDGPRLWDLASGDLLAHIPGAMVASAFFGPGGDQLFTSGKDGLLRWPVAELVKPGARPSTKPQQLDSTGSGYNRACISPDGKEVAYACGTQVRLLNSHLKLECPPPANWVALSPDRQWVAASPWAKFGVRLWNARTGEKVRDFPFSESIFVAFTPDSRWLVTGAGDEFCFWDLKTGKPGPRIPRHDTAEFQGPLSFSPDGTLLAVAISRTVVELLDAATFEPLVLLQTPKPQMISWIAFSPSSRQLAVATSTPFIQLWDLVALRGELALLGLDWNSRTPAAGPLFSSVAQRAGVRGESIGSLPSGARAKPGVFLAMALGAVALTILLALSVLKRQRNLVQSYRQIDELATQRAGELEVAQRELLHSQKMKALGTLAAGIAHDFNNLLSVIRLSNDVIGRDAGKEPSVREEVDSIETAIQQGRSVVRSMLGYSRDAADKPCAYAVGDVLADTVALLTKQFLGGILLTIDVDRALPKVWGAPSLLEQILLNLIVNAAEAMQGQGNLLLAAKARPLSSQENLILRPPGGDGIFGGVRGRLRPRHRRGNPATNFRAVLHDENPRHLPRHRLGPLDSLHARATRWAGPGGRDRTGTGDDLLRLFACFELPDSANRTATPGWASVAHC